MTMDNVDVVKKKIDFFYKRKVPVHVSFTNGKWRNGAIQEVGADFFILYEFKDGPMPVFFIEINSVDQYINAFDKKRQDIHLAKVKLQKQLCEQNTIPFVIPDSGYCAHCNSDLFAQISLERAGKEQVTKCWHCHRSYVE